MDFEDVRQNRVTVIIGKNQTAFWKGCNVTVYETGDEGDERVMYLEGVPNGQGVVGNGIKLYITQGKVKEE